MKYLRRIVEQLTPYTPGEQPKIKGLIKLNTNENPYGPSPKVLNAVKAAVDARLRLYPNPTADGLRERLAEWLGCQPQNIIVGNGSDELLAMASRAFVDPVVGRPRVLSRKAPGTSRHCLQFFDPSYSLYPVLAAIHGVHALRIPLPGDFQIGTPTELRRGGAWDFQAALTYITTPNAPTGTPYPTAVLEAICQAQKGVVLLDEAYVDYAPEHALSLALKYPNVLVARTFSKSYSLCYQRVGYAVGHPQLIAGLHKIRDSYNVNGLGQVAALATLEDLPYYRANIQRVIATREQTRRELQALGFEVLPSATNFLFVRPPRFTAEQWLARLREHKILVRWFSQSRIRDYLRISIGTEADMRLFVRTIGRLLKT